MTEEMDRGYVRCKDHNKKLSVLSPEIFKFASRIARGLQTSAGQVLGALVLMGMAEIRTRVAAGNIPDELAAFPREPDGSPILGQRLGAWIALNHQVLLLRAEKAEEKLAQLQSGVDGSYVTTQMMIVRLSRSWEAMRAKLETLDPAVPLALAEEMAAMRQNMIGIETMPVGIGRLRMTNPCPTK